MTSIYTSRYIHRAINRANIIKLVELDVVACRHIWNSRFLTRNCRCSGKNFMYGPTLLEPIARLRLREKATVAIACLFGGNNIKQIHAIEILVTVGALVLLISFYVNIWNSQHME